MSQEGDCVLRKYNPDNCPCSMFGQNPEEDCPTYKEILKNQKKSKK